MEEGGKSAASGIAVEVPISPFLLLTGSLSHLLSVLLSEVESGENCKRQVGEFPSRDLLRQSPSRPEISTESPHTVLPTYSLTPYLTLHRNHGK